VTSFYVRGAANGPAYLLGQEPPTNLCSCPAAHVRPITSRRIRALLLKNTAALLGNSCDGTGKSAAQNAAGELGRYFGLDYSRAVAHSARRFPISPIVLARHTASKSATGYSRVAAMG
jgi:hypothetical protein